jgi:hypothetical protein
MGYAARLNPRSREGKSERAALNARLVRFCAFFPNRDAYEAYLIAAKVTEQEAVYLEQFLPERLKHTLVLTPDQLKQGDVTVASERSMIPGKRLKVQGTV